MNKVSIFSPVYGTPPAVLRRSIASIRAQTHPVFDLLTVDDGGPPDSWDAARLLRVRVICEHDDNLGLAASCNTALKHCDADFLGKIDSDVELSPFWLDTVMPHFRDDRVAGVGGRMVEVHAASVAGAWRARFMPQHHGSAPLTNPPGLFGADCIFRVSALQKVGAWNPRYRTNFEDMDLSKRLMEAGHILIYEPRALARHLRTDNLADTLTNFWKWYKDVPEDAGMFDSIEACAGKVAHNKQLANDRLGTAITDGAMTLTYPCWLLFTWLCLADLDYMERKHGFPAGPTKLAIGRLAIDWLRELPKSVRRRAAEDLAPRVQETEESPCEPYLAAFRAAAGSMDERVGWMLETSVLALESEDV